MSRYQPARPRADWVAELLKRGWRGRIPFTIVELVVPSARQFARAVRTHRRRVERARGADRPASGWLFELGRFRILLDPLGAPTPPEDRLAIEDAIRAWPAQRAADFQSQLAYWAARGTPAFQALGLTAGSVAPVPRAVVAQLASRAPRPDQRLLDRDISSPVLIMVRDPVSGRLMLRGPPSPSLDWVLDAIVTESVRVDRTLALLILLTCHATVIERELRPGGPRVFASWGDPLRRPELWRSALLALRQRGTERRAANGTLRRLFATSIPRVIASLRRQRLEPGQIRSALVRRLATAVNIAVFGRSQRAHPSPSRDKFLKDLAARQAHERRDYLRGLPRGQRAVIQAAQKGDHFPSKPSTRSVQFSRAIATYYKHFPEDRA